MTSRRASRSRVLATRTGRLTSARVRKSLPAVDDQIAPPETRIEYIDGVRVHTMPAKPPHATRHCEVSYVLRAHAKRSYLVAVEMLTRANEGSDFAPDASIYPAAKDRTTGGRKIEELAFEITDRQSITVPTKKARQLIARGVRRMFCVLVKQQRVLEWSRETDGWRTMARDAVIKDRCLTRPLPTSALLDAVAADEAVVKALLEKQVPALEEALQEREARGEARGEAKGELKAKSAAILTLLKARGVAVSRTIRTRIASCTDSDTLDRWFELAVTATDAATVVEASKLSALARPRR